MQVEHDAEIAFEKLARGRPFRFYHRDEAVIGLKAALSRGDAGALILTPTKAGLTPGNIVSAVEVGQRVVELKDVAVVPSTRPNSITPGAGHFAQPGEIELQNGGLVFVTTSQGGVNMRVDLNSGTIGYSTGERPTEIYSVWSVVKGEGDKSKILYEHTPAPADSESITVVIP